MFNWFIKKLKNKTEPASEVRHLHIQVPVRVDIPQPLSVDPPFNQEHSDVGLETGIIPDHQYQPPEQNRIDVEIKPAEEIIETELTNYVYPILDLLNDIGVADNIPLEELEKNKNIIVAALMNFNISISSIAATAGPAYTLYEVVPAPGIRVARIVSLQGELALYLNVNSVTIATIPVNGTVGITVPNRNKRILPIRAMIETSSFIKNDMILPIAFGKKTDNTNFIVDLARLPHLLISGATGQGKSVAIHTTIISLLYKKHPSELKFILIDTKKIELNIYNVLEKHFLAASLHMKSAVITEINEAIGILNSLCNEMDARYSLLKDAKARDIISYNEKLKKGTSVSRAMQKQLPYIVLIIDEYADIIDSAREQLERPLSRLAQGARAVGIHMIIATQHPSAEVITSDIKACFLGRIAFKVTSKINSRTILDEAGAERLTGNGDMLISFNSETQHVQGAFITTSEIQRTVDFIAQQQGYATAYKLPPNSEDDYYISPLIDLANRDKLFNDCARCIVQIQNGSTSNLQRRFNLGYNRAGPIIDQLEAAGIVGPAVGSKPRDVYYQTEAELEQFLATLD